MKNRIFLIILSLILVSVMALSGCKGGNNSESGGGSSGNGSNTSNTKTETQDKYDYVEGTLHDVNVDYEKPVSDFVTNGNCGYRVVIGNDDTREAALFVLSRITEATGAFVDKAEIGDVKITKTSKYIVFGADLSKYGLTMPGFDTLNVSGYRIQNYGSNVFINAHAQRGYQMGGIAFLRAALGYDMFSADLVIYDKVDDSGKTVMPAMDITEKPDYDYITDSNKIDSTAEYGMGYYSQSAVFMDPSNSGTRWVHNVLDFITGGEGDSLNESAALKAVKNDPVKRKWLAQDGKQICFTAHGDIESYNAMVEAFVSHAKTTIIKEQSKTRDTLLISAMDNLVENPAVPRCTCDACNASNEYYGGTMAGAQLILVNTVAKRVSEWLKDEEGGLAEFGYERKIYFGFLSYSASQKPPVEEDANGNAKLKKICYFNVDDSGNVVKDERSEDLKCEDNVLIYTTASGDMTKPIYESSNVNSYINWGLLGGDLYIWSYERNYKNYLFPFNSYGACFASMRFWKTCGARYVYWEGTWENSNCSGFAKLNDYIDAKAAFDVNADYQALVDKFFKYYFGEGSEYMYEYFVGVQVQTRNTNDRAGKGYPQTDAYVENKEFWPFGLINTWNGLIEKAQEAVSVNKGVDDERYEVLSKHILIESLFPRYLYCDMYADMFDDDTLLSMRKEFVKDFKALANSHHREHFTFDEEVLPSWGLN